MVSRFQIAARVIRVSGQVASERGMKERGRAGVYVCVWKEWGEQEKGEKGR